MTTRTECPPSTYGDPNGSLTCHSVDILAIPAGADPGAAKRVFLAVGQWFRSTQSPSSVIAPLDNTLPTTVLSVRDFIVVMLDGAMMASVLDRSRRHGPELTADDVAAGLQLVAWLQSHYLRA